MNDNEKYMFDLQGYIAVPDAISENHLRTLNTILDEHIQSECELDMMTFRFQDNLRWGNPYIDLIDNPKLIPYLDMIIGAGEWRVDHVYLDVIRSGKGPIGTRLDGGGVTDKTSMFYRFDDGKMRNGLCVVAYNLAKVGESDGGFGCVPGSHKANFPFPEGWREMSELKPCLAPSDLM